MSVLISSGVIGGFAASRNDTPPDRLPNGRKAPSPDEQREVERLRVRDREVRAHEAAHAAAAGALGGRPSLDYVTGPDGQRYAVSGEVAIDTSAGRTPEETIARARAIRAAATAPANPSAQDMAVASDAARMEAEARSTIRERQQIAHRAVTDKVDGPAASEERPAEGATASAPADPEAVLQQLAREQVAARGGMGHSHLAVDCGFCRRASSSYA